MSLRELLKYLFFFQIFIYASTVHAAISLGVDQLFSEDGVKLLQGKNIGLVTNQTGVNSRYISTIDLLKENQKKYQYHLSALFAPEHGLYGEGYAGEKIESGKTASGIPIFSLHGATRRPTKEMLKGLTLIIFDIQDIGSRSYTYLSTLFYVMEEAAKAHIPVLVLDRPNPLGGLLVDGPMLESEFRSFVGYVNVAYCHGMTAGELACFFNEEYKIGCELHVLCMKGWRRSMLFHETGLQWIPTSPNIPDAKVAFYYPAVGMLGELEVASIGVHYTLPFQLVAAPWIDGAKLATLLNQYALAGVHFVATYCKPVSGRYAKQVCKGVLVLITDKKVFRPYATQCAIFHALKKYSPKTFLACLHASDAKRNFFYKICGTKKIFELLSQEECSFKSLLSIHEKERERFIAIRRKYLKYDP